jgi:hypothetical protein
MTKHKNPTPSTPLDPEPHPDGAPALATKVLYLPETPKLEDIPSLCHKAIASIISKANHTLMDTIRKKEGGLYKKSPKRYHDKLKTAAGLQPRAKDQPNLTTVRDPATNEITSNPQTTIDTIQSHYEREHAQATLDTIPAPPWKTPTTQTLTTTNVKTPIKPNTP